MSLIRILLTICFYVSFYHLYLAHSNNQSSISEKERSPFLSKYLFYDINPPEGFNLRRDVYMRLAVFMKSLESHSSQWHLVLPPWAHLYHWKSIEEVGVQNIIPWNEFFDVESMKRYTQVLEMHEVLKEIQDPSLDVVLVLQNFKDAFTESWSWEDKWEFSECINGGSNKYTYKNGKYYSDFWGYNNVTAKELYCVSFQGQAKKLVDIFDSIDRRLVMIDHAEIVLHDWFGNAEYWRCRRSMRFSNHLVNAAHEFREYFLNSTDVFDRTVRPLKWEDEILHRNAVGGNYLSVHLRRQDFEISRNDEIPNVEEASWQISRKLEELKLTQVFISTDGSVNFIKELQNKLLKYKVVYLEKNSANKKKYKDGGLAIIDQIICSHARYFIGSYESTFSFRIQEEREILGFPVESTFNRFCGSLKKCSQPTKWLIVH